MRNFSILGLLILALLLFFLNAVAGSPALAREEGPDIVRMLGDEGAESDTDYP